MKQVLYISFFFALLNQALTGQEQSIFLDSIQVISTRMSQKIKETGRSITILQPEELKKLPVHTLGDLLSYIPGIEIQNRGPFGTQSDISVRGSTFTQVLVLLDGVKLNDPLTGHFNHSIPLVFSEIDRIEVVRGAASVLFGPDAVGGVIHIITKAFQSQNPSDSTAAAGRIQMGDHRLLSAESSLSGKVKKLYLSGGGQVHYSTGFPYKDLNPGDFSIQTGSLSGSYSISEYTRISFRTALDSRNFSAQRFYTQSKADSAREITSNWWNQIRIQNTGEKTKTYADLSYKMGNDDYRFNSQVVANRHTTQQLVFQVSHFRSLTRNMAITSGMQGEKRGIESNDRGNHEELHMGIYMLGIMRIKENIIINGGIRTDWDENYGIEVLPQLSASWNFGDFNLRSSTGRSVRTPDFTERFIGTGLKTLSGGRNLGNPDLLAEQSWTTEIGGDLTLPSSLRTGLTVFTRSATHLIDYVMTPAAEIPENEHLDPAASYYYAGNIGSLRTTGSELYLQGFFVLGSINLSPVLAYTYLDTRNNQDIISKYLSYHAQHLSSLTIKAESTHAFISITGFRKDRKKDKALEISGIESSYTVFHVKAGYKAVQEKLQIILQVNNLLNRKYYDFQGVPMPGQWISTGIQWQF